MRSRYVIWGVKSGRFWTFDRRQPSWILRKIENSSVALFLGSKTSFMPIFVQIRWTGSNCQAKMWFFHILRAAPTSICDKAVHRALSPVSLITTLQGRPGKLLSVACPYETHAIWERNLNSPLTSKYRWNNAYVQKSHSRTLQTYITYISQGSLEIKLTTMNNLITVVMRTEFYLKRNIIFSLAENWWSISSGDIPTRILTKMTRLTPLLSCWLQPCKGDQESFSASLAHMKPIPLARAVEGKNRTTM